MLNRHKILVVDPLQMKSSWQKKKFHKLCKFCFFKVIEGKNQFFYRLLKQSECRVSHNILLILSSQYLNFRIYGSVGKRSNRFILTRSWLSPIKKKNRFCAFPSTRSMHRTGSVQLNLDGLPTLLYASSFENFACTWLLFEFFMVTMLLWTGNYTFLLSKWAALQKSC